MGSGSTTMVQLARTAVDTCLQVLLSVWTVITCRVPNTPGGSLPSGRTSNLAPGRRPWASTTRGRALGMGGPDASPLCERVETGHGRETERKDDATFPGHVAQFVPPLTQLTVLPRASGCGLAW